ncbi:MAG: hypothetical protein ACD_76C00009G0002 [uncultured bacterium]|nr:MAG: hypothetical protein ACD_76C00009G0002 [uncultured bacterium]
MNPTQQQKQTVKTAKPAHINTEMAITSILKRSGKAQDFEYQKLSGSIEKTLLSCGSKDRKTTESVCEQVYSRLIKSSQPLELTSSDIREIITATLIDNNLIHAAKAYIAFRNMQNQAVKEENEIYGHGIDIKRYFTRQGVHPYDEIAWEKRDARITNEKNEIVFEQKEVEVPACWSQTATNIVVQKYFQGKVGTPEREQSVKQLIDRVAITITGWGRKDGYFVTKDDADTFESELTHILANQMAAFNSPVWFNVGVSPRPQCSACFINSVSDDMRSIMHLAVTETMLFKGGSGTGTNLSTLRSSREYLSRSNNKSSGPVSFMKGLDAFAGVVKSGGKTRRAAKMVILNIDHPDIEEFITCKANEEKKAWALIDAGYDSSMDGSAYSSIFFQNANNSVRVTDAFMNAVEDSAVWTTTEVTTGKPNIAYPARELMNKIAQCAWQCGDPGVQYDTTINRWNTCKSSGRINASNPCSEYMFLDDTACNLASLNLMKFRKLDKTTNEMVFDVEAFKHANEIIITAMEIIIGNSSYPTPAIEKNTHVFRSLGIGYANLGALLMSRGLAYDSDRGRSLAAAITALQTGQCYLQSSLIAEKLGAFSEFEKNRESSLEVMRMHRDALKTIDAGVPADILSSASEAWNSVVENTQKYGLRNSQISVLAPTGTIAFFMDCDTTGIEPDIALVKYKWLVGGGMIKIVNNTVPEALTRLGYSDAQIRDILQYIEQNDTIEGAPHISNDHLSVFDCAFRPAKGKRYIHYMGHIRMMSAVQPFLSGAISKTVNMPTEASPQEIYNVYMEGWKMGIKALAIYRDGSKRQQAITTTTQKDSKSAKESAPASEQYAPRRRRLTDERRSLTHKFSIGSHEGYITVGLYDDGTPGEIFITMSKEGSVMAGLMNSFATSVSLGLQYGVPLRVLVNKFVHVRFEPSGYTNNPQIRIAKSIIDYIFRWMAMKFLPIEDQTSLGIQVPKTEAELDDVAQKDQKSEKTDETVQAKLFDSSKNATASLTATFDNQSDAPACDTCGSIMVRNGACYKCLNCGCTSGCS